MADKEIVEAFYTHLNEMERGIGNLIYRLGDEYDDAKQSTIISLIQYNKNKEINPEKVKQLMFVSLKNMCIKLLKSKKAYSKLMYTLEKNLGVEPDNEQCIKELSSTDKKLKEHLLKNISIEDYQILMDYFNHIYDPEHRIINKKNEKKVRRIKKEIGFSREFKIINLTTNKERTFESLKEVCEWIGTSNCVLSKKFKQKMFKHNDNTYRLKLITKLKNIPNF